MYLCFKSLACNNTRHYDVHFRENGPQFWTQTIIALGFVKHVVAQQIIVNSQIGMLSRYEILQHDKNNSHKCSLLDHDYISWQQK